MTARLDHWLTAQAERRPDATALVFGRTTATYQYLEEASNRLARALKAIGCVPGDRVGLLLPKSIDAVAAMFAVLKADCIYVPVDTASPAARIGRILQSCECHCVLAQESTAALLDELAGSGYWTASTRIGWVDRGAALSSGMQSIFSADDIALLPGSRVDFKNVATAAHILFTSGSTGMPKGVVISHANVIHFVCWAIRYFGTGPEDRISCHPPLHFDLSTFDVFGSIAAGAELHLLPPEASLLPHRLAGYIRTAQLTQWFSVPAVLQHMRKFNAVNRNDFPSLRRVLWCGERLATPALRYWMQRLPHVTFTNLYGPTETTIASSYYRVPACPQSDDAEIPIGAACDGESLLVLDSQMNPVLPGCAGDLYIGGAGLSPGYWRDQAKTRELFVPNPSGSVPGERIYRTGDLARVGEDGMIYLVGRADSQIKIRGHRVELGEVEAAVHAVPGLAEAAVVAIESESLEGKAICCAYVAAAKDAFSGPAIKQHLALALPRYMLPAQWMALEAMPRNGNGKIDRPLLARWFQQRLESGAQAPAGTALAAVQAE